MSVRDSRGQLLLIGGILIALGIVGTVVFINGIQYTQEVGSTDQTMEVTSAAQTHRAVQQDLRRLLWYSGDSGPYSNDNSSFKTAVQTYSVVSANMTAAGGSASVRVRPAWSKTQNGSVVGETFADLPSQDTTIATDVEAVPAARLNVTGNRDDSDSLALNISSSDSTARYWTIEIQQTGVYLNGSRQLCEPADIDPTDDIAVEIHGQYGTVTTSNVSVECASFTVAPNIDRDYDVILNNSHHAQGRYHVTFTESPGLSVARPDEPDVIVNPAYTLVYESDDLSYETKFQTYNTTEP